MDQEENHGAPHTVVALFEDMIDAERTLVGLRKGEPTPVQVSLVLHDQAADNDENEDHTGAVARAIVANDLDAVGDWLRGLSSVIVPRRGTYLVAGPIGAMLAGVSTDEIEADDDLAEDSVGVDPRSESLLHALHDFGFADGEASYIDHRLEAGSILVGVTADNESPLQAARRIYAAHAAVYIGIARTGTTVFEEAMELLATPPERASGDAVIVTDMVAPIRRLSVAGGSPAATALRDRSVLDSRGRETGSVEDVLLEVHDPGESGEPEREIVRYLVVGFGGVLGLGRHHVAVPIELVDAEGDPARLRIDQNVLKHTPPFDENAPFSRREEMALLAFFGLRPYWLNPAPPLLSPAAGEPTDA